jgi:hypothetical protein
MPARSHGRSQLFVQQTTGNRDSQFARPSASQNRERIAVNIRTLRSAPFGVALILFVSGCGSGANDDPSASSGTGGAAGTDVTVGQSGAGGGSGSGPVGSPGGAGGVIDAVEPASDVERVGAQIRADVVGATTTLNKIAGHQCRPKPDG